MAGHCYRRLRPLLCRVERCLLAQQHEAIIVVQLDRQGELAVLSATVDTVPVGHFHTRLRVQEPEGVANVHLTQAHEQIERLVPLPTPHQQRRNAVVSADDGTATATAQHGRPVRCVVANMELCDAGCRATQEILPVQILSKHWARPHQQSVSGFEHQGL